VGEAVQRRLNRVVLLWGAVLLPLAFWPPFEDAFKLPQTFLVVSLLVGLMTWATWPEWTKVVTSPPGWWWPAGAWCLMAAFGPLLALCPGPGGWGAMIESQRWMGFTILAYMGSILIRRNGGVRLPVAMAVAGAMSALYSLIQFFWSDLAGGLETRGLRPFSTMGNPDFLAAYLIAVFPLMVSRVLAGGNVLWWLATAVTGLALLIAQSRGAWLGIAAAVVAAPVLWRAGGGRFVMSRRLWLTVAAALVAVTGYLASHGQGRARLTAMFSTGHFDATGRLMMWRATMWMVRDRPVLGAGPGSYARLYPDYHARLLAEDPGRPWFFSENAHNDTLQLAAETGAVGLGVVIWLLAVFWRIGWKAHRDGQRDALPILLGLVALVVDAQVNFPWYLVPAQGWVWLSLAWLASRRPESGREPAVAPWGPHWVGRLFVAGVVVSSAIWGRQLVADGWLKLSGDFAAAGRWPETAACASRSWNGWGFWEGRSRAAGNAALAEYSLGRWTEAESWARAALSDAPGIPAQWNQLGLALARQGKLDEADAACREAIRLNPHQAESWHTLGNIAFLRRDRAGAAAAWQRALVENPSLEGARQSLHGLRDVRY